MKKILHLLLSAALIFTLTACSQAPAETGSSHTQQEHPPETSDPSYQAPQITELYHEDFDYTDAAGNRGHFTYRVPQIEADTQGAKAINQAIADAYSPIVDEVLQNVSDQVSLSCLGVTWKSYPYENLLSLVVSGSWDADISQYRVYLYDMAGGRQLTTADLLKTLHVDETTFLEAVRRAAAEKFDAQYGAAAGEDSDELLAERRAWTLSDANINLDVPAYADASGTLHVVLPIGSIAGADSYEQILTLDSIRE